MIISKYRFALLGLLCAVVAASLLFQGLGGDFIFDDKPNLVQNTALHVTVLDAQSLLRAAYSFQPGGGSRALAELTFAIDYWRAGLDPSAFKVTNLVIHLFTTMAVSGFFRVLLIAAGWRERRATIAALAMAFTWAAHPLQVSSVLYVVQRMQTLCTLFVVLALTTYVLARQAQRQARRSRLCWVLTLLFGALAFASKEDAVLLPAYGLALELTILGFEAANPEVTRGLRKAYFGTAIVAAFAYIAIIVPHFWHSANYPGRDFSTPERLLTQARVLVMYLSQILWPLPSRLQFYYDGLSISRGLLQPVTTVLSIATLTSLLAIAWRMRTQRPVFALGVFLFFAGHILTSNVIGLELAFEHRNHFPLIGVVLATGDLARALSDRLRMRPAAVAAICTVVLAAEAGATLSRATTWGDPLRFARTSTEIAPESTRAWLSLCGFHYERSGRKANAELDSAIEACRRGGVFPQSAAALANVVLFKTIRGDVTQDDWNAYLHRLERVAMSPENVRTVWVMLENASTGVPLDDDGLLRTIDIVARRSGFGDIEYARIGYFILQKTKKSDSAYPYFVLAVEASPPKSRLIAEMLDDLAAHGHVAWSARLRTLAISQNKL